MNSRVGKWLLDMLSESGSSSISDPSSRTESTANLNEKEMRASGNEEPRIRGWVLMDYYDNPEHGVVPLFVECNFRGRRAGEEGW